MSEATITDANENTSEGTAKTVTVEATTGEAMRELGKQVAHLTHGGDVILLSGHSAQENHLRTSFGAGLNISEPIVSPTFTIARELKGQFPSGNSAHLIHVDAYRLGGNAYAPGQNAIERLLDELESLGLDEELEDPSDNTIILMEWGEQMAAALAPERLEIHIDRPLNTVSTDETSRADNELTSNGTRTVTFIPVGASWQTFDITRNNR